MDKERYIQIINENRGIIYKICFTYCSNPEDQKDLQQEILIRLWNGLDRFDSRAKLSTWIYRVALNTAISYYRIDRKRSRHTSLDSAVIVCSELPEENWEYLEDLERLYFFIEELKELDKALILLYLDDIKYSEIAGILGITETNVATKINRIKEKLRKKFGKISKIDEHGTG